MSDDCRLHVPDWKSNVTLSRLLGGRNGTLKWSERLHSEEFAQRVLREVHAGQSYLTCSCSGGKKPKLYVAKHNGAYRVSRYPMTGHLHGTGCYFYDRPATQSSSKTVGSEDNVVRLSHGRKVIEVTNEDGQGRGPLPSLSIKGVSYSRQKLLGLLRSLWETAGLNVYDPGLRMNWGIVRSALEVRSQTMTWAGAPFSNSLIMPIPPSMKDLREAEISSDRTKLAVSSRDKTRVVLIAPVRGWLRPKNEKGKDHAVIDLAINAPGHRSSTSNPYKVRVLAGSAVFNRMSISYARGYASVSVRMKELGARSATLEADPKLKVVLVALCKVTMGNDGTFTLIAEDACMDVLTRDFIPCDSSYEVELARALAVNGRKYRKPLINSEWENMLPDFELLDVGDISVPLEVFGFSTEAYLEVKSRKIAAYVQSGRAFWYWDPGSVTETKLEDVLGGLPASTA